MITGSLNLNIDLIFMSTHTQTLIVKAKILLLCSVYIQIEKKAVTLIKLKAVEFDRN